MRLVVVDDSVIVREGLVRLLDTLGHDVVAGTDRHQTLDALIRDHRPDAVILDIKMPPTFTDEGLRVAAAVRSAHPGVAVLVLSQYTVADYATRLLQGGERGAGYLLKDRILEADCLASALQRLAAGETVVDPALVAHLVERQGRSDPLHALSARERDVLRLLAEGLSDKGIAAEFTISLNTVGTHVQRVFHKLGLPEGSLENRRVLAALRYLQRT